MLKIFVIAFLIISNVCFANEQVDAAFGLFKNIQGLGDVIKAFEAVQGVGNAISTVQDLVSLTDSMSNNFDKLSPAEKKKRCNHIYELQKDLRLMSRSNRTADGITKIQSIDDIKYSFDSAEDLVNTIKNKFDDSKSNSVKKARDLCKIRLSPEEEANVLNQLLDTESDIETERRNIDLLADARLKEEQSSTPNTNRLNNITSEMQSTQAKLNSLAARQEALRANASLAEELNKAKEVKALSTSMNNYASPKAFSKMLNVNNINEKVSNFKIDVTDDTAQIVSAGFTYNKILAKYALALVALALLFRAISALVMGSLPNLLLREFLAAILLCMTSSYLFESTGFIFNKVATLTEQNIGQDYNQEKLNEVSFDTTKEESLKQLKDMYGKELENKSLFVEFFMSFAKVILSIGKTFSFLLVALVVGLGVALFPMFLVFCYAINNFNSIKKYSTIIISFQSLPIVYVLLSAFCDIAANALSDFQSIIISIVISLLFIALPILTKNAIFNGMGAVAGAKDVALNSLGTPGRSAQRGFRIHNEYKEKKAQKEAAKAEALQAANKAISKGSSSQNFRPAQARLNNKNEPCSTYQQYCQEKHGATGWRDSGKRGVATAKNYNGISIKKNDVGINIS